MFYEPKIRTENKNRTGYIFKRNNTSQVASYLKQSHLADWTGDQSPHGQDKVIWVGDKVSQTWPPRGCLLNPGGSGEPSQAGQHCVIPTWEMTCSRCVPLLSQDCQVWHKDCSLTWKWCHGEEKAVHHLFVNLSWHAKYFHFCSGSRSAKDGAECLAHCGGAVGEDLPSAHQMWELRVGGCGD